MSMSMSLSRKSLFEVCELAVFSLSVVADCKSAFLEGTMSEVLGDEEHCEVADHFATRRDLDDVAEELVDVGVGVGDFLPAVAEAHGVGLFLVVGVLAAGHLVEVDFGGAAAGSRVEGFVVSEDFFPVVGEIVE